MNTKFDLINQLIELWLEQQQGILLIYIILFKQQITLNVFSNKNHNLFNYGEMFEVDFKLQT